MEKIQVEMSPREREVWQAQQRLIKQYASEDLEPRVAELERQLSVLFDVKTARVRDDRGALGSDPQGVNGQRAGNARRG